MYWLHFKMRPWRVAPANWTQVQFWGIWLYELRGVIPLLLSFNDMIPSRYFRCVVLFSRPIILASPQLISDVHVALCLANPPSPVFILSFALSTFPLSISVRVSLTLSICSFLRVSHLRSVSPVYLIAFLDRISNWTECSRRSCHYIHGRVPDEIKKQ